MSTRAKSSTRPGKGARGRGKSLTAGSRALAERVVEMSRATGLSISEPRGRTGRYVRIVDAEGKTVAYVEAHVRAPHEISLLRGDPEKIREALPDGRDDFTRRFTAASKAARALRAASAGGAGRRRREYVAA